MKEVGDLIRDRVRTLKLPITAIAKKAELSKPTVYGVCNGKNDLKFETAVSLMKAIGLSIDDIIGLKNKTVEEVRLEFLEQEFKEKKNRLVG